MFLFRRNFDNIAAGKITAQPPQCFPQGTGCTGLIRRLCNINLPKPKLRFDMADIHTTAPAVGLADNGEAKEYLLACLKRCRDLGSNSVELQKLIKDQYSQFQLSGARANLIRGLDLSGVRNVLEIGSGCGPITRYLGEKNLSVHAVEACPVQADLTRMRCRDLDNVQVTASGYQEMSLPESRYDLAFMIGTLEDALFCGQERSPGEICADLVGKVKNSLRKDGVLVVAAANATGLTFWTGAGRTRHGVPAPGNVTNGKPGCRNKDEWRKILAGNGKERCAFIYPFPDYRYPRVLLGEDFVASDPHPYSLLYRVLSQDRYENPPTDDDDFLQWRSLHASGNFAEYAPSLLMLISASPSALRRIAPFDFIHFSSEGRKPGFRTSTLKLQKNNRVEKRRLSPRLRFAPGRENKVVLKELESGYEQGPLLTTLWLEALNGKEWERCFTGLLADYYAFISEQAGDQADITSLVDLLPSNLIIGAGGQGRYRIIDQEWTFRESYSSNFILFRALLWFGYHNRRALARRSQSGWSTLRSFIAYCFSKLSLVLETELDRFVALENGFHAEVSVHGDSFSTHALLETPL